jgi:hypothetical protein
MTDVNTWLNSFAAVAHDIQNVGGPENAYAQKLSWLFVLQKPTTKDLKFSGAPGYWQNTSDRPKRSMQSDRTLQITTYTYWPWSRSNPKSKPDVPFYLATGNKADRQGDIREPGFRFNLKYCTSPEDSENRAGNALCVMTLRKGSERSGKST